MRAWHVAAGRSARDPIRTQFLINCYFAAPFVL